MPKIQMLIVIYGIIIHAVDSAPLTCLPITDEDPCPPDHEVVPCTTSGTQDGCNPCPPGLRMCDATTSELSSKCYDPREACSADGDNKVHVTDLPGGGCTIRCICNESAGFSGPDPLQCQSHDQACDQSSFHESDSHHCLPCPENQHNPHDDGLDKCVPRSTQPSAAGEPQHTLLVPPKTPTPQTTASTTTTAASAALDTDNDNDNDDDMRSINSLTDTQKDNGTRWYIWIISVLIAGIFIIRVAVLCSCKRQNGKTNAENHNYVCCVFGHISNGNDAVFNQGLPADNYELQHLKESDTEMDESAEQEERPDDPSGQSVDSSGQPVDPPEQPVDSPGQAVDPPERPVDSLERHVDPPEESEYSDEGTPPKSILPRYSGLYDEDNSDPPPYSLGQYMPGGTEPTRNSMTISESGHMPEMSHADGPDTTHRKMEPGLSAGEYQVNTSQDGPFAMTPGTTCATPLQPSSLRGQRETWPKEVVQGHVAEVSETERKIQILGIGPVESQRITDETPVVSQHQPQSQPQPQPQAQSQSQPELQAQPQVQHQAPFQTETQAQGQNQAQPEVQSQLQGQPQHSVVDSHSPRSPPSSLGGESLHMSSFNSEFNPTTY